MNRFTFTNFVFWLSDTFCWFFFITFRFQFVTTFYTISFFRFFACFIPFLFAIIVGHTCFSKWNIMLIDNLYLLNSKFLVHNKWTDVINANLPDVEAIDLVKSMLRTIKTGISIVSSDCFITISSFSRKWISKAIIMVKFKHLILNNFITIYYL